ncbi:hypothetical protein ACFDAU_06310 [Sulfuriferula sp. GW1]|uniref:hypothetical protein n=1 Tax=Sulfuriferula sp. GW1 TaxID=3345111 RepID=UPI0039AFCFF0
MTENQLHLRAASLDWMLKHADQFTLAVTLTLKPYRVVSTQKGDIREALTAIEAQRTFRQFLNRLNASLFGNAKRHSKSVSVIPLLEGQATKKPLHYHCALGGFPADICDEAIAAKITSAWHQTSFGNQQIDIQPMQTGGWLTYAGKEIGLGNADVVDWENVRLSAASLT